MTRNKRPVFINLFQIKLPVAGVMSIAHRAAGVLMFVSIPFWLFVLELSLKSPQDFARAVEIMQCNWLMPFYLLLLWSLFHHLLAGIRYLLLDIDIGVEKPLFRQTAWTVLVAAPVLVLLILAVAI
ncbi:MAG: succinate dehydrogenase, cytochrome b556 subunit [Gammaproteobacteria bacterium]|nr:succinate dehydrogenase, cytochrome b556 subunit [Gammaproteobacteria bacterium]NNJ91414.1 succinate dehydrogenase, cytochrome b556 subunit [Gammaproteobacteria bacterium]